VKGVATFVGRHFSRRSISLSKRFVVKWVVKSGAAANTGSRSWPPIKSIARSVQDSSRKWRSRNPDYWKQYREKHPESVTQNREKQKTRDRRQRLLNLANNTSALDLKHSAAGVWLLNEAAADLANNNSVSGQVWVIEALPGRKGPGRESCKQQPAGVFSTLAG
jgi:hypothetical protein